MKGYNVNGDGPPEGTSRQDHEEWAAGLPVLHSITKEVTPAGHRVETLRLRRPDGTTLLWSYRV